MSRLSPATARHLHREIILTHLKQAGVRPRTNGAPYGENDTVEFKGALDGAPGPGVTAATDTLTAAGYTVTDQTTHLATVGFASAPLPLGALSETDQDLLDRMIAQKVYWQARMSDWSRTQHDPNHTLPETAPTPLTEQEWLTLGYTLAAVAEANPGTPASTALVSTWVNARRDDYRTYPDHIYAVSKAMPTHVSLVAPEAAKAALAAR